MVFPPLYRNSMKTRFTCCATALGLILVVPAACNRETPVRTRDDIAADSALAADLALANRDTLVIDSIGQYRPTGQVVPSDTDLAGSDAAAGAGTRRSVIGIDEGIGAANRHPPSRQRSLRLAGAG